MESVGSLCESLPSLRSFHINDEDKANRTRGSVLAGNFNTFDKEHAEWKEPSDRIVVFVSSTFDDTMEERNIMLKSILPDLQKKGREQGIQVQFADMRYGVKDESTLRQMTWDECSGELMRCFENSAGIAFLSLQSDRYGYRPLPRTIKEDRYLEREKSFPSEVRVVAQRWYRYNSNTGSFILKSLSDLDDVDYWKNAYPVLLEALDGVIFDDDACPGLKAGHSITEWEVRLALELEEKLGSSSFDKAGWAHRRFLNGEVSKFGEKTDPSIPPDDPKSLSNSLAVKRRDELKNYMRSRFIVRAS